MKTITRPLVVSLSLLALISIPAISRGGIAEGNEHNTHDGNMSLQNNTTGNDNTALGDSALYTNTIGNDNSASGYLALFTNLDGNWNTAAGSQALFANTNGGANTATGYQALYNNTTASGNTATGFLALFGNTTGASNTATGLQALNFNTVGNENTATGSDTLFHNTTGNDNTVTGANAGQGNTTGAFNTVNGASALHDNQTASFNTADGAFALNLCTGGGNIAVGYAAGINITNGNGNIDIGNQGLATDSVTIRIGLQGSHQATFVAGIFGTPVAGVPVVVDANGQLGTGVSASRFKTDVKPMSNSSDAIFSLQPVTYRYKDEIDRTCAPQYGLIAEEVAKVNPALVARDASGKIYTVRYEAVNAMLLNEFLKEHRKVEQLQATVARQERESQATAVEQQKEIKALTTALSEQGEQIQKVQAAIELNTSRARVVGNQ